MGGISLKNGTVLIPEWQILLTVAAHLRSKVSNSSIHEICKSSTME